MNLTIQRWLAYLATPSQAQEKINDLTIELKHRGLNFSIQTMEEDGYKYLYAKSIDYPRGWISATGETIEELELELKDAIFAAFEVPPLYSKPELISFTPALSEAKTAHQTVYATS